MYVVNVDDPTSTATIHLIGGCSLQREPGTRFESGQGEWSYAISNLREARDYALMARKQHTRVCEVCERNDGFGA